MGTASTMACLLVGLGLMPFRGATAPAVSATRLRIAEETGANAVAAFKNAIRPQSLLTKESFLNALTVLQAIGGSTNAVVHLMAIVGRHEDPQVSKGITLDTVDEIGRKTPLLVDLKPSGDNYMTDFHNSGGMRALLEELRPLLHLEAKTITGRTLGEELDRTPLMQVPRELSCIQPFKSPLYPASSLAVLRGNLAPGGAVIKASASKTRSLLTHSGPAVVFTSSADMAQRLDDPDLDVTENSVLVLQSIGPAGNPGMPEAGMIPIPRKLAFRGVVDMLRLSDGRMSGTAGGSIILHISPEAADPDSVLGIVKSGDIITCNMDERVLRVELSDDVIKERQQERRAMIFGNQEKEAEHIWTARDKMRGYKGLFMRSVTQAERGADFDFLTATGPNKANNGQVM